MNLRKAVLTYTPYLVVSLAVLGPLLLPGYVLSMDMVFTPNLRVPDHVDNTWLLYMALHLLDVVLPADIVQKLVLLSIFILSGIGMHRLLQTAEPRYGQWRWVIYVGAIFYMVNPFVYDRLMAGQWGVLLGYSLLPWFTASLLRFGRGPTVRRAGTLTAWAIALSVVSIHAIGYMVILVLVMLATQARNLAGLKRMIRLGLVSVTGFAVLSAYWLMPAMMGTGRIGESLAGFSQSSPAAFATVDAVGTGQLGAVLGLMGFWQENRGLYIQPIESHVLWGLTYVAVVGLVAWGAYQAWRYQRVLAACALGAAIIAILLATGIGHDWLVAHAPFFAGYREPQKFTALLALTYSYFIAWGSAWLLTHCAHWWRTVAMVLVLTLPFIYTPTLLWGAAGQLRPTDYPSEWSVVNSILDAEPDKGKALVLPWHLYMSYGFTDGRIIASPAPAFFNRDVLTSDDPELPGVRPQTPHGLRETVQEDMLPILRAGRPVAEELRRLGISHVILHKELEWQVYRPVSAQAEQLYDGHAISLYRIME